MPQFHEVSGLSRSEYFCTSDPVGHRVGSGGGTVHLLREAAADASFRLGTSPTERCIILHAGGQSRRLPAYASVGKLLTPMPPLEGEPFGKTLLELQLPLYERLMDSAPESLRTLIVSGDVLISAGGTLPSVPEADVVCYGIPAPPERLRMHGVYAMSRQQPLNLDFMLQKPSLEEQQRWAPSHNLLLDVGLWMLSERALKLLSQRCTEADGTLRPYDLYGQFGTALGMHPSEPDAALSDLSVIILPLPEGRFLHFGTSRDLLSSTVLLTSQPNPDLRWVENADVSSWGLTRENIVTGVPTNAWEVRLKQGQCVDMTPVGDAYALRPYGFDDPFRGAVGDASTTYLGRPMPEWIALHGLQPSDIEGGSDMQSARLFPLSADLDLLGRLLRWMLSFDPTSQGNYASSLRSAYLSLPRLSADEISNRADLAALTRQRMASRRSSFHSEAAFARFRQQIFDLHPLPLVRPEACRRQVVGTSPLRIDVAGGWTDTPATTTAEPS